jgi:hypothetical protein
MSNSDALEEKRLVNLESPNSKIVSTRISTRIATRITKEMDEQEYSEEDQQVTHASLLSVEDHH